MRILLTRPIEDSQRSVEALRSLGHESLVAPLFQIKPLHYFMPPMPDYLLATSANAIRVCDKEAFASWLGLPFFAVGDATADAAKSFGFSNVISASGDSVALADLITTKAKLGSSLLQLAGKPRRDAALHVLHEDFHLTTLETYETVACEKLPSLIADAITQYSLDVVMHFSPRAAKVFMDLIAAEEMTDAVARIRHICISNAARDERFVIARIAEKPTLSAMIEAISTV